MTSKNKKDASQGQDDKNTRSGTDSDKIQSQASAGGKSQSGPDKDKTAENSRGSDGSQDNPQSKKGDGTGPWAKASGQQQENDRRSGTGTRYKFDGDGNSKDFDAENQEAAGDGRKWQGDQNQDEEYSRDWDTLQNEQFGQMTQGSYNPRNNRQAWSGGQPSGRSRERRQPPRQWDRDQNSERGSRRYADDNYERPRRHDRYQDEEDIFRGRQWGQTYAQAGRGFADEDGSHLRHENRDDRDDRSRENYDQRWRGRREDSYKQRNQGYDAYGSSPGNFGTQQYRNQEEQHWNRNQGGQYSDYENPHFGENEYGGASRYGNRDYDNYGSEFDGPYESGNRMRRRDFDEHPARERSFSRGYQYGTDGYNSGSNQMDRDYDRESGYRNSDYGDRDERDRWETPRRSNDSYSRDEYERSSRGDIRYGRGDDGRRSHRENRPPGNRRRRGNW